MAFQNFLAPLVALNRSFRVGSGAQENGSLAETPISWATRRHSIHGPVRRFVFLSMAFAMMAPWMAGFLPHPPYALVPVLQILFSAGMVSAALAKAPRRSPAKGCYNRSTPKGLRNCSCREPTTKFAKFIFLTNPWMSTRSLKSCE